MVIITHGNGVIYCSKLYWLLESQPGKEME